MEDDQIARFCKTCISTSMVQILNASSIKIEEFLNEYKGLNKTAGIYVFWWSGNDSRFRESVDKGYLLKGPHKFSDEKQNLVQVEICEEWINHKRYNDRICLYVGKTTQLHTRIKNHVKLTTKNIWKKKDGKTLRAGEEFSFGKKPNTVSQLRIGVERLFKDHSVDLIKKHVQVSFLPLEGNKHAINRFFIEDRLIGQLFPIFNMDIER